MNIFTTIYLINDDISVAENDTLCKIEGFLKYFFINSSSMCTIMNGFILYKEIILLQNN
jgi:hypothetical protein